MAVDYFHRLIVRGSHEAVRAFRRRIYSEYPKQIGNESWTEIVPFSFRSLYEIAPRARRIEQEIPCDPYEISWWPTRRIGPRKSEIRYQFQTRNMEMIGLIRVLSRAVPSLTFTLATLCLDDSDIEVYRLRGGKGEKSQFPEDRRDFHWSRAGKKFGLTGDELLDNDEAEHWVEEEMLHEALNHWDNGRRHSHRRQNWWNKPPLRDLATERQLRLYEIDMVTKDNSKELKCKSKTKGGVRRRKSKNKSKG